jgi:hypothetical protein
MNGVVITIDAKLAGYLAGFPTVLFIILSPLCFHPSNPPNILIGSGTLVALWVMVVVIFVMLLRMLEKLEHMDHFHNAATVKSSMYEPCVIADGMLWRISHVVRTRQAVVKCMGYIMPNESHCSVRKGV